MTFMKQKSVKLAAILLTCVATLLPKPALAQLAVGANTNVINLGVIFIGNDIAYDPDHNLYLSVAAYGAVYGVFVSTSGAAASSPFRIGSAGPASYGHYPRTIYSRDLNGGGGGFLVTWHQGDGFLHSVVVASPSGAMSAERLISDGGQSGTRAGGNTGLAFSPTSHRFLVTWTTGAFGIQGRFLDSSGAPSGPVTQYVSAGGAQEPQLAWNPATDDFGLIHGSFNSVVSWIGFMRIPASGASPAAPTAFGYGAGTFSPSISVNTSTNHYIVGWSVGGGAYGTEVDQNGFKVAGERFLASRLGTPTSFELAYNPASDTFLAVSEDPRSIEVAGIELTSNGSPISVAVGLTSGASSGSFVPRLAARTNAKEWSISYARNMNALANQLISTGGAGSGGGGGGDTPPPPPPPPPAPSPTLPPTGKLTKADVDGDGRADITVFRPSAGNWVTLKSRKGFVYNASDSETFSITTFGIAAGDMPISSDTDFDGDGKSDVAFFRPTGTDGRCAWFIKYSSNPDPAYSSTTWGFCSDKPVPADFDGDRKADIAVYRPSTGRWYVLLSGQGFTTWMNIKWGAGPDDGLPGPDTPVVGDYDGDKKADFAVYRPSTGRWYVLLSSTGWTAWWNVKWGLDTTAIPSDYAGDGNPDMPVQADYDGDGLADFAVWRPSQGVWFVLNSTSNYTGYTVRQWGIPGDAPMAADFDGDGRADVTVYRPSTGRWFIMRPGKDNWYIDWGLAGDIPVVR